MAGTPPPAWGCLGRGGECLKILEKFLLEAGQKFLFWWGAYLYYLFIYFEVKIEIA